MKSTEKQGWFVEDWKHIRRSLILFFITYIFIGIAGLFGLFLSVEILKSKYDDINSRLVRIENALIKK